MADTYAEARDAIQGLIVPAWDTATSTAPLMFDNLDEDPTDGAVWGRLTIKHTGGGRANIGPNGRFRRTGMIFVQIFVPKNSGTETADAIGEALVEAIEDAGGVGNVWFRDVAQREIGVNNETTYFQVNVEASFTFDRVT
jgi:hypothetical protein